MKRVWRFIGSVPLTPFHRMARGVERRSSKTKRAQRRGVPIHAYVGPNGGGKTLAMVYDTEPTLKGIPWSCDDPTHRHTQRGVTSGVRRVLSTVEVLDPKTGLRHHLCDMLRSWRQLLEAEHCDVLLDEITGVANSRSYNALPVQLLNMLVQLRKRDVCLRYTTPNWARTDVALREVTQAVTICKGFLWQDVEGSLWPSKRLFFWRTYDAIDWEDFSMEKVEDVKPLCQAWYWRPRKTACISYNTYSHVQTLDHLDSTGLCVTCGGKRAHPKCICPVVVVGEGGAEAAPAAGAPADEGRYVAVAQAGRS